MAKKHKMFLMHTLFKLNEVALWYITPKRIQIIFYQYMISKKKLEHFKGRKGDTVSWQFCVGTKIDNLILF